MNRIYNSITRVELFYILLSTLVFLYTYILNTHYLLLFYNCFHLTICYDKLFMIIKLIYLSENLWK